MLLHLLYSLYKRIIKGYYLRNMENKVQNSDEISLHSVKESVLDFLLLLHTIFHSFFSFVFRNKKVIIISTLLFTLAGVGISFLNQKIYKLQMTVLPTEMNRKIYAGQFEELNKLVQTKSYQQLSKELKLAKGMCAKLRKISCFDIYGDPILKDSTRNEKEPFIIEVSVTDNTIGDTLQSALLSYINNNLYLSNLKKIQEFNYLEKLKFVESEQRKLDSLKEVYSNSLSSTVNKAMFYNNAFNPSDLYKKSSDYQYEKDMIFMWLGENKYPMRIIDGFKPALKPDSISAISLIILSTLAGFIIGICIAGNKELGVLSKQQLA